MPESASKVLRTELVSQINQLRESKGVMPLQTNVTLRKAAKCQSYYMAKRKMLTHNQGNFKFANPLKRVRHFKGYEFDLVGENVLQSIEVKLPLRKNRLVPIALEMFNAWKNSPGHYANMVNPEYEFTGIDFALGQKENVIYATQVFAKKGIQIDRQLSDNAFGIKEGAPNCKSGYNNFSNVVANMGNAIYIEGNQVKLYYHNIHFFNRILDSPNDGLAVDLVVRDQVSCDQPNQLDCSPIYDGVLLEPVFKRDILKNNEAESEYRIIASLGTIPDAMLKKNISPSLILIQDGKKCEYLLSGYVPRKTYKLRPIEPILYQPSNVQLKQKGITKTKQLTYKFRTDVTTPIHFPIFKASDDPIHSIRITSFSSVEGSEHGNIQLHQERAKVIKEHLLEKTKAKAIKVNIEAKENWEKMYFQLEYNFENDLAQLPKDSIRALVASDDETLPWDSLLFIQRQSTATINYYGKIASSASLKQRTLINFRTAVADKDFELANQALYKMYQANIPIHSLLSEQSLFEALKKQPELIQNTAALLTKTPHRHAATVLLFSWLNQTDQLPANAIHNLLHLHTLLCNDLLEVWDLPSQRLANVIHPNKVTGLINESTNNELVLNLHLTFIKYFGQVNDGINISKSFDFITKYFKSRVLKIEDEIDLVLFFNRWSMYQLTKDHLLPKFKKETLNEEAIFILLQTMSFYDEKTNPKDFEAVYLKALSLNRERWCQWVDSQFQILRDGKIKNFYCEQCNVN